MTFWNGCTKGNILPFNWFVAKHYHLNCNVKSYTGGTIHTSMNSKCTLREQECTSCTHIIYKFCLFTFPFSSITIPFLLNDWAQSDCYIKCDVWIVPWMAPFKPVRLAFSALFNSLGKTNRHTQYKYCSVAANIQASLTDAVYLFNMLVATDRHFSPLCL